MKKKLELKEVAELVSGILMLVAILFGGLFIIGLVGVLVWNTQKQAWIMLVSLVLALVNLWLSSVFNGAGLKYENEILKEFIEKEDIPFDNDVLI